MVQTSEMWIGHDAANGLNSTQRWCILIGACERHCNIFGTISAGGEGALRRTPRAHGVEPDQVRQFKLSNDLAFAAKLKDIVGLYVDPPDLAIVLSIEGRPMPDRPRGRRRPRTRGSLAGY